MDIKEYIASGILEEYLFGTLSPQEVAEVEEHLALYPELRDELAAIEQSLEGIAMSTGIEPPADLKDSIISAIEVEDDIVVDKPTLKEPPVVPIGVSNTGVWKFLVAASVTFALVASYLAYDYRARWKDSSDAFAQLQAQNEQMAEQYNQVNNRLDQLTADIDIIGDSDFKRVSMTAVAEGENLLANVYWNAETQEAYLKIQELKKLSEQQQYQLWAIVDEKPVDMGVFDGIEEGLIRMKNVANASMFAVTIEPKGGSENPTLDKMQVAGGV